MKPLHGETALITGAARRLGRATALALAEAGADVVVHYRDSREEAEALRKELVAREVRAWTLSADFASPEEVVSLIDRAKDAVGGPLTLLVNNASVFPAGTYAEMTWEEFGGNARVNAWAPFVLSRALAGQTDHGAIVNLLDARIAADDPGHAAYHVSKRMLEILTEAMAREFAPGIRVNAVAPGLILPPPGRGVEYLEAMKPSVPLQRHGDPKDVAEAVLFLLRSEFITGQILFVDGGRHLLGVRHGG